VGNLLEETQLEIRALLENLDLLSHQETYLEESLDQDEGGNLAGSGPNPEEAKILLILGKEEF